MNGTIVLSADSEAAQAVGSPTIKDGVPTQRFLKPVIPAGRFTKREKGTNRILWDETFTRADLDQFVKAFNAMKTGGVPVRLKDETGKFTIELPSASPLTKNHAGVFDKDRKRGVKTMVENIVADTVDMFVDEKTGWLNSVHEVAGQDSIDLVKKAKFTSPEIEECYIDGSNKEYGRCIRAISLVANPLIPGQKEFEAIAASEDSPVVYVMTLHDEDISMPTNAALFAIVAALAGVEVSKVTDDTAPDLLKGVQTRMSADADRLRVLSEESPAPSKGELRASAKSGLLDIGRLETAGVISAAGAKELSALWVGNADKLEYSPLIMSADDPDDAAQLIEKTVDLILKHPGIKKGPKTPLQDLKALSEDGNGDVNTPLSPERVDQLLSMSTTGREIINKNRAK